MVVKKIPCSNWPDLHLLNKLIAYIYISSLNIIQIYLQFGLCGKISFAFWELEINFLSLLFYFSEAQTWPLFANREPQSLSILVSHRGASTCCQHVRQETTTEADPSNRRLSEV